MSELDPDKLKVVELREALESRGLETQGTKSVLVNRLKEYIRVHGNTKKSQDYDPTEPTLDTDPITEFGDKRFINAPARGISFSLSTPKAVKNHVPIAPAAAPIEEYLQQTDNTKRSGATSFFLSELARLNDQEQKEAKVPLPPSFGYKVDSDDDSDEDGPPGAAPLKPLPALKFDKPFTKNLPKDNVESWRGITMPDLYSQRTLESRWVEGVALQDPALFLQQECVKTGTQLVTEIEHTEVPGLSLESIKMKVTYGYLISRGQASTKKEAMDAAALKILKDSGPWLDEVVLEKLSCALEEVLPKSCFTWLPPKYNLTHVRLDDKGNIKQQKRLYSLTVKLGPLCCRAVGDTVEDALQYLSLHIKSFLKNRNVDELKPVNLDDYKYTQGPAILRVTMEDEHRKQELPPLDLFVLQNYLIDGSLPALYCKKDVYGCEKVFSCDVCCHRISGVQNLISHVQGERHKNLLGSFTMHGKIVVTFKSSSDPTYSEKKEYKPVCTEEDREKFTFRLCVSCEEEGKSVPASGKCQECCDYMCSQCCQAHSQTRLTKSHVVKDIKPPVLKHPRIDAAEGKKIRSKDEKYLIDVYRCPTKLPDQSEQEDEEYSGDVYEGEEYQDESEAGLNFDQFYSNDQDMYYNDTSEGFRRKKLSFTKLRERLILSLTFFTYLLLLSGLESPSIFYFHFLMHQGS